MLINTIRFIRHSINVGFLSYKIAIKNKLKKVSCSKLFLAGLLHDIGKLKLNNNILYKKDKLSEEEFEHIKKHIEIGVQLLKKLKVPEGICRIVEQHHELSDGTGYPKGLKDDEISIEAKILRTADVYDALTSNRSYRKKYTKDEALNIMSKENTYVFVNGANDKIN